MQQIKTNLDQKLEIHYGNIVPDRSSAHLLLQRTVANILENRCSNEEIINEETIMDCLIQLGRTAGKIKCLFRLCISLCCSNY
jgi:hypothetical protein